MSDAARHRAKIMRQGLDLGRSHGLEIGALAEPMVARSDGPITYVDFTDTATLRRLYADNPEVDAARIVDVDAVWGERTLSECLGGVAVDYVMASHVAEHVPDLITWLAEIGAVLKPGGELRLAMPDHRFSDEILRPATRLVDVLAAWLMRARRPRPQDVLDFRLHESSGIVGQAIFDGVFDASMARPRHRFETAIQSAEWARDNPELYFDVHCWAGQAGDFAALMQALAARGLLPFACRTMIDTGLPQFEFYTFMTLCNDTMEAERSWAAARTQCRDPLPGSAAARRNEEAAAQAARRVELPDQLAEARAMLAAAAEQLRLVHSSASWRVTAPLRLLGNAARTFRRRGL